MFGCRYLSGEKKSPKETIFSKYVVKYADYDHDLKFSAFSTRFVPLLSLF